MKIKIFLWLVRRDKILTKLNLVAKGWQGDTTCVFCDQPESTDHLFTQCSFIRLIWIWIANHNNFTYNCHTLDELWLIDASIPLKDRLLVELLRGVVLWTIWLEKE